jgi:intracellular multiplication protein IcmN
MCGLVDLKIKKKWFDYFIISLVILLISGCHSSSYRFNKGRPVLPSHLIPSDPEKIKQERKLTAENIQVIQQGQYILISIPAALLFANHSPQISWQSYSYLNDVACYIKMFRKVEVEVNAYDTQCDKHQRVLALTELRASNIGNYLTSQGIDSRIVFTRGMGNDKPIMKTDRQEYHFANSRIEILFKEEII